MTFDIFHFFQKFLSQVEDFLNINISVIPGLPELFNPVASTSKYKNVLISLIIN